MDEKVMNSFLRTLSYALKGEEVSLPDGNALKELKTFAADAINHQVLPLIVDGLLLRAGRKSSEVTETDQRGYLLNLYRNEIVRQAQKTADFLLLYEHLAERGIHPLVMKGIICRSLYPEPEHRTSADEDLLIDPKDFWACHEALITHGLRPVKENADIEKASEVSYQNEDSHLYIEVHKTPFDSASEVYGNLNLALEGVRERPVIMKIYGTNILTLGYTDHLLFLILHAFKHFLYSGFGIRQVCDIILFSEAYRDRINWKYLQTQLKTVHAFDFARAIYKIGKIHLLPVNHTEEYLRGWDLTGIEEGPLLSDIMDGGLYGASTMARLHASNMTLHAMKNRTKPSGSSKGALVHSVFQPLPYMQERYSYLKKLPALLPLAWAQRVFGYLSEVRNKKSKDNNMAESIRIGNARIELLKYYHIIEF